MNDDLLQYDFVHLEYLGRSPDDAHKGYLEKAMWAREQYHRLTQQKTEWLKQFVVETSSLRVPKECLVLISEYI